MSRTLDALRKKKRVSLNPDPLPRPSNGEDTVLASLGYLNRSTTKPGLSPVFRRILAGAIVVAVGAILWQVAVMNRLVPAGLSTGQPGGGTPTPVAVPSIRQPPEPLTPTPLPVNPLPPPVKQTPSAVTDTPSQSSASAHPAPSPALPAVTVPPANADRVVREPAVAPPVAQRAQASRPQTPAGVRREAARSAPVATSTPAAVPVPLVIVPSQTTPPLTSAATGSGVMPRGVSSIPPNYRTETGNIDRFKLALYYQRNGDFENALVQYRALLEVNELNAEAHNNLGLLYLDKTLYEEAIREFSRATFIDPNYFKAHNNLGVALLRSGKADAAVTEFRWIVAQDSRNLEALTNLALSLKTIGRLEEAREVMQRAISLNSKYAPAHYNLALIYEESGDLVRAIQHYESFLAVTGAENATLSGDVRARMKVLRDKLIR